MNYGRTILTQLMDFLPMYNFDRCFERYQGNKHIKSFSCWNQYLCMAFAQLAYRESLRDIEACLRAIPTKRYHMGIRGMGVLLEAPWPKRMRNEAGVSMPISPRYLQIQTDNI
jgi:hypothetical protein